MKNLKLLFVVLALTIAAASATFAQNSYGTLSDQTIAANRGKVVVLAVGASWLPLSKQQAIITAKLSKKYAGRDVVVYFVATDSANAKSKNYASDQEIQAFAAKNRPGATILRDSDGAVTLKEYKIDQLPSFIVFDKDGKLASEPFGGLDPDAAATDNLANLISQRIDRLL